MPGKFRFTFGPWNIHEGADVFGPAVRETIAFDKKLEMFKSLGFDGVQFHDDDAVPGLNGKSAAEIQSEASALKKRLDNLGLAAEFVAPRLWEDPMTIDGMDKIVTQVLNEKQQERFQRKNEMDLALSVAKLGRFRINLFRQRGTVGVAVRSVSTTVPSFDELNLPDPIKKLAEQRRGLIIITGTTGSGKSTSLAALIEQINANRSENIMTVEDPIEYIYRDKKSIVSQREVGGDTETFASALRAAFRQDRRTRSRQSGPAWRGRPRRRRRSPLFGRSRRARGQVRSNGRARHSCNST